MNTDAMIDLKGRAKEAAAERDRYIAEIARLSARPTEEEVADAIYKAGIKPYLIALWAARAVLALFPSAFAEATADKKVQP